MAHSHRIQDVQYQAPDPQTGSPGKLTFFSDIGEGFELTFGDLLDLKQQLQDTASFRNDFPSAALLAALPAVWTANDMAQLPGKLPQMKGLMTVDPAKGSHALVMSKGV